MTIKGRLDGLRLTMEIGSKAGSRTETRQLRDAPATTERDIEHKRKLRERLETMVSEKRTQRAPECDIWTEVGRIAVSQ